MLETFKNYLYLIHFNSGGEFKPTKSLTCYEFIFNILQSNSISNESLYLNESPENR